MLPFALQTPPALLGSFSVPRFPFQSQFLVLFGSLQFKSSRLQGICSTFYKKPGPNTLEGTRKHLRLGPASKKRTRSVAHPCHLHSDSKNLHTHQHFSPTREKKNLSRNHTWEPRIPTSFLYRYRLSHHNPYPPTINKHHNSGQNWISGCDISSQRPQRACWC